MVRYALLRAAILGASLAGAALFAAAVALLAEPHAAGSATGFIFTLLEKVPYAFLFDFGRSSLSGLNATAVAAPALLASLQLLAIGALIAIAAGIPLGIMMASADTRDVITPLVQFIGSVPVFCGALLIGTIFAAFAPGNTGNEAPSLLVALGGQDKATILAAAHAITPAALTVGLAGAGAVALSLRNALDVAAAERYRDGLRRLGLSESEIVRVYVARHAFALALKDLPDIVLALFAAAAVAEWIFTWPGAGAGFIHAVALEDWPVVAIIIFVIAIARSAAAFLGLLAARALIGEVATP